MIHVIITVKNNLNFLMQCLESVKNQDHPNFDVCIVDDNSSREQQDFIKEFCFLNSNFFCILNSEDKGALYNQFKAIKSLQPQDADIIAIVDGDDRLARYDALSIVQSYYDEGYLLTYGSYVNSIDGSLGSAKDYPEIVKKKNRYRRCGQLCFNHLRTFSYKLFKELNEEDFKFPNGQWFKVCADTAIMIPCLELAGGNYKFIDEVLYIYNSENVDSDWRKNKFAIEETHRYILYEKRKKPLYGIKILE